MTRFSLRRPRKIPAHLSDGLRLFRERSSEPWRFTRLSLPALFPGEIVPPRKTPAKFAGSRLGASQFPGGPRR